MNLTVHHEIPALAAGVVVCRSARINPASVALETALTTAVAGAAARGDGPFPPKDQVRDLLRSGGFKPSGRSKPASEYLAQAAREARFPRINNLVDANNLVSLTSGLPISLLDRSRFGAGMTLRYGRSDERYVFNGAGHAIDLAGLIVACDRDTDQPLGNAVKDSMAGKISDATTDVVGIIYGPKAMTHETAAALAAFAAWLAQEGETSDVQFSLS